jgi:hypothetical protein
VFGLWREPRRDANAAHNIKARGLAWLDAQFATAGEARERIALADHLSCATNTTERPTGCVLQGGTGTTTAPRANPTIPEA